MLSTKECILFFLPYLCGMYIQVLYAIAFFKSFISSLLAVFKLRISEQKSDLKEFRLLSTDCVLWKVDQISD